MPITKSAVKALRQNKTRKTRNIIRKKAFREAVKDLRALSLENKKEEASKLLPQVYKAIDKATKRGLLKKNTASRKKSRLTKLVNKLGAKKKLETRDKEL